ncbi:DUF2382 domain-containing protein [Amycolatopsis carbonis]|uniref:DUF2382 domain-containing protein n=1 Tax=Amycolatopsis carbonis TaxID=715471 RepID=A0A9Y2IRR6_9PSEU|nr:DUF2382 domain-containing protein [Amycolatopsis sp. 2-15]WIX84060.1 DUF2382 domain-containing protein [Amycolatopsis sp. 2-15]
MALHGERPVVETEAVPVERVRLAKEEVTETETATGELAYHLHRRGASCSPRPPWLSALLPQARTPCPRPDLARHPGRAAAPDGSTTAPPLRRQAGIT